MNKAQLINEVSAACGLKKKEVAVAVDATIEAIVAAIKEGDKVQLSGFGTFEVKEREARVGRNPRTREAIEIPAVKAPVFKASKVLKDTVSE